MLLCDYIVLYLTGVFTLDEDQFKLYQLKAQVIQAAGHPIRLAIIEFLSHGEQCVCDIVKHVEAQRSNVSRHLAVMLQAGIVSSRKDGLKIFYSLKTCCLVDFLNCVERVLKEKIDGQDFQNRALKFDKSGETEIKLSEMNEHVTMD